MSKERLICIDLETYHTRDPRIIEMLEDEAREKRPANNTLKELKLTWDTEQSRAERVQDAIDKTAVDPLLAEVLCAAVAHGTEKDRKYYVNCMDDEAVGLRDLRDILENVSDQNGIWIGHNIEYFDLPILLNRWRHHGIKPPTHFPSYNGHWRGRVFDTMKRIPSKTGFVSLDNACQVYGITQGKSPLWLGEPMCGSRVGEAFEADEHDIILEYCLSDIVQTVHLYQVMTAGDTWGTYDTMSGVSEQILEITESNLSEAQKAIAKIKVLETAGLIPA